MDPAQLRTPELVNDDEARALPDKVTDASWMEERSRQAQPLDTVVRVPNFKPPLPDEPDMAILLIYSTASLSGMTLRTYITPRLQLTNYMGDAFEIVGGITGLERQLRGVVDPTVVLNITIHLAFTDGDDKTRYHIVSVRGSPSLPAEQDGEPSN